MPKRMFVKVLTELRKKQHIHKKAIKKTKKANKPKQNLIAQVKR